MLKAGFINLPLIDSEASLRRVWCRGKRTITPGQRLWVRYMLSMWGEIMGGDTAPVSGSSVIGRLMVREKWDEGMSERIINVVNRLHEEGLIGEALFQKAREIVIPQSSGKYWLDKARVEDDADFVEKVMTATLRKGSPLRTVALMRYCGHNNTWVVAKELERRTGCHIQAARKRIAWCEKILEEEMYYAIHREIEKTK